MYKIIFALLLLNFVISPSYSAKGELSGIYKVINDYCAKGAIEQIYSQENIKRSIQKLDFEHLQGLLQPSSEFICHSAYSIVMRRLTELWANKGMQVLNDNIDFCRKSLNHKNCEHFTNKSFIYDLTTLLSTICNQKSFKVFQKLNCFSKETNYRNCSLFQGLSKDINACPNYYYWRKDYRDLFKHYTNPRCQSIQFKRLKC